MSSYYDQGVSGVNNAYNKGQDALNSFDPSAWYNQTKQGFSDLFGGQQGQQNDYINSYKNAIAANPSVGDLYTKANQAFNVPQLSQNAATLNNAVLTAPQTTLDSAKGFNYDNNQVQNQTNLTLGRLSPLASAATNQSQQAQNLAGQAVQAGIAQNNMNLLPIQQQGQMMSDLWARQASGFTTAAEGQLNGLIEKMKAGTQLSEQEMQQLAELSKGEMSYQSSLNTARTQLQQQQLANQYQHVPAGDTLINTFNGYPYTAR